MLKKSLLLILTVASCTAAFCAADSIPLPSPAMPGKVSLKTALENRRSDRKFSDRAISAQDISNLLWCANGANRKDGHRTVPAAMGRYAISLYIAFSDGLYRHDRAKNTLEKIADGDFRAASDGRKMGASAGMVVIMAANETLFGKSGNAQAYVGVEAGAITQNIYLYCAAAGFNTVVCGSFDAAKLNQALKLPAGHRVLLTQVVGFRE